MVTPGSAWSDAKQILCIRLDSVGDVLMTTPAIRALRESLSGRTVTLLTSRAGAAVAELIPEIDQTIVYDAPWMKATAPRSHATPDIAMIHELREQAFDAAVIFTVYSQNPLPAALLCFLAGIPLRLAYCRENPYQLLSDWVADPEPAQTIRHEVRRHLDLVNSVGARSANEHLSLRVRPEAMQSAQKKLRWQGVNSDEPVVVIHPGATAPSRRYPPELFAQAATRLWHQTPAQIIFTGDASELELIQTIRSAMPVPSCSLAGMLSLEELGAVLSMARVLLVNNTGPAHMAAALGIPVVDLYALTNPQHTPWQVASRVLFEDVPCRFCYKSTCPQGHHRCLRGVSPERVVEAVLSLFNLSQTERQQPETVDLMKGLSYVHTRT